MGTHHIEGNARSTAVPAAVFAVLRDRSGWPSWSELGRYEHVTGVEGEVGGTARLITGPIKSVERITEVEPDHLFGYELISGLPIRNYVARVEVTPDGDGARIRWQGDFEALPGVGFTMEKMLGRFVEQTTEALAKRAAQ